VQDPEPGTALHRTTGARLPEQLGRSCRVSPNPRTVLIEDTKSRAPGRHPTVARYGEQLGAPRIVAKDVFTGEEPEGEVVAGLSIPRLAVTPELLRFLRLRVAPGEKEGGSGEQDNASRGLAAVAV
jgi:hypothetical protein